jgi:hypothetical protein
MGLSTGQCLLWLKSHERGSADAMGINLHSSS